jgi:hypothetical protein
VDADEPAFCVEFDGIIDRFNWTTVVVKRHYEELTKRRRTRLHGNAHALFENRPDWWYPAAEDPVVEIRTPVIYRIQIEGVSGRRAPAIRAKSPARPAARPRRRTGGATSAPAAGPPRASNDGVGEPVPNVGAMLGSGVSSGRFPTLRARPEMRHRPGMVPASLSCVVDARAKRQWSRRSNPAAGCSGAAETERILQAIAAFVIQGPS